jgi:hypothetical protein
MNSGETVRKLSEMTDDAAFERLVTAVLREAKPEYESLIHTGINTKGKTVKAPLDGITFVTGAQPPHMIAAHHTTCDRTKIKGKWLHDPASVKPRKGGKPTAPTGDLLKTAKIVAAQRKEFTSLRATLILTTNCEPPGDVVCETFAAGRANNVDIDIWAVRRIAHFLDNTPQGQRLRREHLGIEQELLSRDMLAKLSRESLRVHSPQDQPDAWVTRSLDRSIAEASGKDVLFIVAESGFGKSVACYKRLAHHVDAGGYGFVIPHEALASALTVDQAIETSLRQLHPQLASGAGTDAQKCCSPHNPLLLVVEDINKSDQAAALAEKLAKWALPSNKNHEAAMPAWRILCPIWPQIIASLGEESRKWVQALSLIGEPLSASEGREAVQRRARQRGKVLSDLDADGISEALGHDPLLIALHELDQRPRPENVIDRYIDWNVEHLSATRHEYPAAEYKSSLNALAAEMLRRRQLNPGWIDVLAWFSDQPDTRTMLRHLADQSKVIRLDGNVSNTKLNFRHDRVRDALFTDALAAIIRGGCLDDILLAEPYFAEVIGAVLARADVPVSFAEYVYAANPLALFYALKRFREPTNDVHLAVLRLIDSWLANPDTHGQQFVHLRWAALSVLAETESPMVLAIVQKFPRDHAWAKSHARFRNGDVGGGLQLCAESEPGVGDLWRDRQIEHAKMRFGANLRKVVDRLLRQADLQQHARVGALRLAGWLADPQLGEAIETSWGTDADRNDHLRDYLWATAQCCGGSPDRFLGPVCDAWASLSDKSDDEHSPSSRDDLAATNVRWGFRQNVPVSAIPYFIKRGHTEALRWPITYMLQAVDHPDAVEFVVREIADQRRRHDGKGFSPFADLATDEWRRQQEDKGRGMSPDSRGRLFALWQNQSTEKYLREQAFHFWTASKAVGDSEILRSVETADALFEKVLWERLWRGDRSATDHLLVKLQSDRRAAWWHLAHLVWSDELNRALNLELERRRASVSAEWGAVHDTDRAIYELLMRLPSKIAEPLIAKHWDHLRFHNVFVQTALFFATPRLGALAKEAIEDSPDPEKLFQHLTSHYGVRTVGRAGITRPRQIEVLIPYFAFLSGIEIYRLWDACNDHGWFDLRRQYLDGRLDDRYKGYTTDEHRAMESLDKMVTHKNIHWIDHWLDDFTKAGIPLDQAISLVGKWLANRRSIDALRLVGQAIIHTGRRQDIGLLDVDVEPKEQATAIRANTEFGVRRRALR